MNATLPCPWLVASDLTVPSAAGSSIPLPDSVRPVSLPGSARNRKRRPWQVKNFGSGFQLRVCLLVRGGRGRVLVCGPPSVWLMGGCEMAWCSMMISSCETHGNEVAFCGGPFTQYRELLREAAHRTPLAVAVGM
jgi:hypothetical protein